VPATSGRYPDRYRDLRRDLHGCRHRERPGPVAPVGSGGRRRPRRPAHRPVPRPAGRAGPTSPAARARRPAAAETACSRPISLPDPTPRSHAAITTTSI